MVLDVRTRGRLVLRCTVTTKLAPSTTNCFGKKLAQNLPKDTDFFAKFVNTVITTALDYLVPTTTHYSTLDCCHPLLMMMMMIHPQMHHQVMFPLHDQDLLSCTNLFQYGIVVFIPDIFCVQSFCSRTWPKHRRECLF
jgi:hypothetical protein